MNADYKCLDEIRLQISAKTHQIRVLFSKIYEEETTQESMILSEIGINICKEIIEQCSNFEMLIDKIKDKN